jgi:two-component system, sensor histidine kinase
VRVLIIDDMRDSAFVLRKLLERLGYEVETSSDPEAGLLLADTFGPHVICVDIGLPGIDGYEVARRIRAKPRFHDTRMIAVSGYPPDKRRIVEAGIDAYLLKPTPLAELLGAMHG